MIGMVTGAASQSNQVSVWVIDVVRHILVFETDMEGLPNLVYVDSNDEVPPLLQPE